MCVLRNKLLSLLSVVLFIVLLTACQTSSDSKETFTHLESNIISTEEDAETKVSDITMYDNIVYLVNENKIVSYDLASGERTVLVEANDNEAICADKDNIYTYNKEKNAIVKYNKNGEVISSYPFSYDPIHVDRMVIHKDTIIIASYYANNAGDPESELYKFDLSSGESNKITNKFKGNDTYSLVIGLDFEDENTIMITSLATTSYVNSTIKGYRFDLQKEIVLEEFILPSESNDYCYDAKSACFYYTANDLIKSYDTKTNTKLTLDKIDFSSLDSSENSDYYVFINELFYTNDNVIMWNNFNNLLIIEDLSSDNIPINILISDYDRVDNLLQPVIEQFEESYGCNVFITEYSKDVYEDKLRTKLLASDNDFDLFLLQDINQSNLLYSILKYELYEPLDSYDEIVNNFSQMYSGVRSMMSNNDKLFGVPFNIVIYNMLDIKHDFTQYGYMVPNKNWTISDVWKLCDDIVQSGEQNICVFGDAFKILQLIKIIVQEAINQGSLDKDVLTEFLTNIKKYNDVQVLFDPAQVEYMNNLMKSKENGVTIDPDNSKDYLLEYSTDYFNKFILEQNVYEYPEYGTVMLPSFTGKIYHELLGCALINKHSKNKEMATKFIEVLTSSKNIYNTNIYDSVLLGPELTKYNIYKDWTPTELKYLSELPMLYENAEVFTCYYSPLLNYFTEEVMFQLFDGNITAEEAADMTYDKANYLYFE